MKPGVISICQVGGRSIRADQGGSDGKEVQEMKPGVISERQVGGRIGFLTQRLTDEGPSEREWEGGGVGRDFKVLPPGGNGFQVEWN